MGAGGRTKRHGQPTVNIAGEKMAAFLNEMKSVRLKKVGGGSHTGPSAPAVNIPGVNSLARSWSAGSRNTSGQPQGSNSSSTLMKHGLSSFRSLRDREEGIAIGEKRKRDLTSDETQDDICTLIFTGDLRRHLT